MPIVRDYNTYKEAVVEYSKWREDKDLRAAKRKEYLRKHPDEIKDYDLQRVKILLNAVEMMDKSLKNNSNKIKIAYESITNMGLSYAAIGGTALAFLTTKLKPVQNFIDKTSQKHPKSKNILKMGGAVLGGVVGVLAAFPAYNFLSNLESKIHRKRKFETMEKELSDPRIFVVLDEEQKKVFKQNLPELEKTSSDKKAKTNIKKEIESIKNLHNEVLYYSKNQSEFKEKYKEEDSYQDIELTENEIKNAKKDKALLSLLIKEINTKAQSYYEKMERITDNMVTVLFALGSLFSLGYESVAKNLNIKSKALPAGMGIFLLLSSTFFATWAQKRAAHVGRFKAIQELKQNPEQLVYISDRKTNTIEDDEIQVKERQKTNSVQFLKDFFVHNKEYKEWKETPRYTGQDISTAMNSVEISPEQLRDGKRLQKNLFKTWYKVDKNTQNFSNNIDVVGESIKYPITLVLGTLASILGFKHLISIRNTFTTKEVIKNSLKYVGIISLFTIPSVLINSYFAKLKKMGARVSDMMTMKEMEDYRFFADYSNPTEM